MKSRLAPRSGQPSLANVRVDDRVLIRYERMPRGAGAWQAPVHELVERTRPGRVCEVGGGANPALSQRFVAEHGIEYVLVDVSEEELAKAPTAYDKLVADAASPKFDPAGEYDFVFTITVAEHVRRPDVFHRNVFRLLVPGGRAFHFFSTLYALPFVANRVLPEVLTRRLLRLVQPGREAEGSHAKFTALYRWCRGPTRRQIARFERIGFHVEEYVGYFGHDYYARVRPLQALEHRLEALLVRRPLPFLTTYASVVLRKPG
jgi:2-polyprenyl-3-methyl-5-hydroxy-6-metoxy-1,4-benzoquinol methylase